MVQYSIQSAWPKSKYWYLNLISGTINLLDVILGQSHATPYLMEGRFFSVDWITDWAKLIKKKKEKKENWGIITKKGDRAWENPIIIKYNNNNEKKIKYWHLHRHFYWKTQI